MVEMNPGDDLNDDYCRGRPVDREAEWRPRPRIRDELTAVLPQVLDPHGLQFGSP